MPPRVLCDPYIQRLKGMRMTYRQPVFEEPVLETYEELTGFRSVLPLLMVGSRGLQWSGFQPTTPGPWVAYTLCCITPFLHASHRGRKGTGTLPQNCSHRWGG